MYIETALVSSTGKLLIQLSDGQVIDAGYVKGSQGPPGQDGKDGAPGIPGAKGDSGANGSRWHTGVGAPEIGLGEDSDLYLDVAASVLPLYQKVGGNWMFLCNLKVTPAGAAGGQGGAAGGGGSIIIYPMPDGGTPPSTDNDGKPIDKGDVWLDTNTGWLWVYDGNVWLPVGDRPPVIISPDPPNYNGASDINIKYPVKEGDLWFDSDQLALYVAAEDEKGDLRWVITTPADRSVLQDEVDIPALPFKFPSPKTGGGNPTDGLTVYNPVTKLWYVYNDKKNQWIDLPPGVNDLSMRAILVRGADDFDETFEFNQADRDRLGTDALCYVNADDHDTFTRIVIPDVDTAGFNWSFLLRAIQTGDQLTLIQADIGDPADPDDDFPFRSDYLTVGEITENSESFNTAISFESESPVHVPLFDEEVIIRFKAIVNTGEDEIYYQEIAPDPITDPELTAGNIWIDSNDNKLYVWNGSSWSEVTACTGTEVGDYVLKAGDTMSGPLVMDNAGEIEMINTTMEMRRTMPNDGTGNWDANRSRYGIIKSRLPRIIEPDGSETLASGDAFGIEIDLSDRNTYRNELKITKKDDDIVRVTSGANPQVVFNANIDRSNMPDDKGIPKGVAIFGIPTPDKDLTPSNYVANKEYVDQREAYLQNEIVELAEEVEALAPSVERGVWKMNLAGIASSAGQMSLYDDDYINIGNPTGLFTAVKSIWLNEIDTAGTPHGFAGVEAGEMIELFVQDQPEFGLYEVIDVHDETNGAAQWWVIEVSFVRTLEATSTADNNDLIRVKIFQAPTGGDTSTFLSKYGEKVIDATATVKYEWNEKVQLESKDDFVIIGNTTGTNIRLLPANDGQVEIKDTNSSTSDNPTFHVTNRSNSRFTVRANGAVEAGADEANPFMATEDHHVATKKYADDLLDFSQYQELS